MAEQSGRPISPVAPDGMDIIFFYKCPRCGRHVGVAAPTEPRMLACDACRLAFPVIPVDEYGLQYVRIMLAGGNAAADPDFM